jgi:hypothetical protein
VFAGSSIVTPDRSSDSLVRAPQFGLGHRELQSVVDARRLDCGRSDDAVDGVAGLGEHRDHVGQVVLALCVVGAEPTQGRREQRAFQAVDRGVDLVDLQLLGRRVSLFDDARDPASRPRTIRP